MPAGPDTATRIHPRGHDGALADSAADDDGEQEERNRKFLRWGKMALLGFNGLVVLLGAAVVMLSAYL